MKKQEMNCETGEIIIRDMTQEELLEFEKAAREAEIRKNEYAEQIANKAEAEAKRQALLDKLGITEDEARLLFGGN